MLEIAAIILTAGRSTRFATTGQGGTKMVAEFGGRALVRRVAEAALGSSARPVIVVTGYQRNAVEDALRGLPLIFENNPLYESGLASSLRCGLSAVPESAAGALILLGDMPLVSAALVDALIGCFESRAAAGSAPLAAVPVYKGERGNPVLIGRGLFRAALLLEGDRGARSLIEAAGGGVVECGAEDDAPLVDVDTQDALDRLASHASK